MIRLALIAIATCVLAGCATGSTRMVGDTVTYTSGSCKVTVYQTRQQAVENGLSKEVCVVEGTSAPSFDHSIEGAIKNNIAKLCKCGVSKAYVSTAHTQASMGIKGVSHVNLVGFE